MRYVYYVFFLIIAITGITFAYLNAQPAVFDYYLGQISLPLSVLVIFAFGIGILFGVIVTIGPIIKLKRKNICLKKHLKSAEKEVDNLRAIPYK